MFATCMSSVFFTLFPPSLFPSVFSSLLSVPVAAALFRPDLSSHLQDVCNEKMIHELFDVDTKLGGEGGQPLYWIQGFCENRASLFDVDEELYYLRCPFYANLESQITFRMPVDEEQKGSWIATVSDGTCSTKCPDFYDVVCFVNNSCWRPIGIMFSALTFICVGVCFLCYLIMMKQKALEKRLVSMRFAVGRRDSRRNPTRIFRTSRVQQLHPFVWISLI